MRITPSRVVAMIDQQYPPANLNAQGMYPTLVKDNRPFVIGLLQMLDQIAPELLVLMPDEAARFTIAQAALRAVSEEWLQREKNLHHLPTLGNRHVLQALREILVGCPDEAVAANVNDLAFIADQQLRDTLRRDISSAKRSFSHGEWKAATVMAGSAIEALLMWAIDARYTAAAQQAAVLRAPWAAANLTAPTAQTPLNRWDLAQFNVIARQLGAVTQDTFKLVDLTRAFRNLIHPGRAERTGTSCDEGTAHAALGGLYRVISDLS